MPIALKENNKLTIIVMRGFPAAPERVFDAWLNERTLGRWLFKTPKGQMTSVKADARKGGSFEIVERRDGEDIAHEGDYLEITRPHRLAFTFRVPKFSSESTTVAITITAQDGGCKLTLAHEGILAEYGERTKEGWTMILNNLAATLV